MNISSRGLTALLLCFAASGGHASVITITEDILQMDVSETFINLPGTPSVSGSFSGRSWSGGNYTATANQDPIPIGDNDSEAGTASASIAQYGNSVDYWMLISNGCISSGCVDPEGVLFGSTAISSQWTFSVSGEDAEFSIGGVNYSDYADTSIELMDLTTNTLLLSSTLSGWLGSTYTLQNNHEYAYSFTALMESTGDPDPNPYFFFTFNNATVISNVPEPATLSLFAIGLGLLLFYRRQPAAYAQTYS